MVTLDHLHILKCIVTEWGSDVRKFSTWFLEWEGWMYILVFLRSDVWHITPIIDTILLLGGD